MKPVKKILNVEYDLSSADFIEQKMDEISTHHQERSNDFIVKVTTYCVPDHAFVVSTTEESASFMGAPGKMLANRPVKDDTMLTMDDDMVKTYEITITKDTDLPDYVTAINVAQAKADKMFEEDDTKIPLIVVIDYRWGNPKTIVSASIFTDTDEDGKPLCTIGYSDSAANVVLGDAEAGAKADEVYKEYGYPQAGALEDSNYYWSFKESENADIGELNWTLKGDAKIENEWLVVNGNNGIAQLDDMGSMHVRKFKTTFMIDTLEDINNCMILSTRSDNNLSRMGISYNTKDKMIVVSTIYDSGDTYYEYHINDIELETGVAYSIIIKFTENTATVTLNETIVAEDIDPSYSNSDVDDKIDYAVIGAYKNSGGYEANQFFGKIKDLSLVS